jgi:hypothetical protein
MIYLKLSANETAQCVFSYSLDGVKFSTFGEIFQIREGQWIGAKMGVFITKPKITNDSGWIDVDWFHVD